MCFLALPIMFCFRTEFLDTFTNNVERKKPQRLKQSEGSRIKADSSGPKCDSDMGIDRDTWPARQFNSF